MTATRNLQVTVKKGGGLTMKTLEGLLAKTDAEGDNKVSVRARFLMLNAEKHHLDKVFRDGRGGPLTPWRLQSDPRKRHLLSSRGVKLAFVGASGVEEEV